MTASPLAPPVTFGSSFNDFYDREGLVRLDAAFVEWLKNANVDVHARLLAARAAPDAMAAKDESNLLIELARPLEDFVGVLFGVAHEAAELRARHSRLAPLYDCKRLFVQRYVARALKPDVAAALDGAAVTAAVSLPVTFEAGLEAWELAFALKVRELIGAEFKVERSTRVNYCIWCHTQGKDSCSKGLKDRKTGAFQKTVLRRDARRLPARREDLRDAHAEAGRATCSARSRS
jgi:hypothetical protein